jgi:hypothetical protein
MKLSVLLAPYVHGNNRTTINGSCISAALYRNLPGGTKKNFQPRSLNFQPEFERDITLTRSGNATVATEQLHSPQRPAASQEYRVAGFAALRVLSCLHSPEFHCSCCDVVQFCCDLEAQFGDDYYNHYVRMKKENCRYSAGSGLVKRKDETKNTPA